MHCTRGGVRPRRRVLDARLAFESLVDQVAKDDDEIIVPKKSKAKAVSTGRTASASMRKLMRITRAIGIALGGFVALVGVMAVVGLAVSNIWVRLIAGLIVVIGLPAFLSDRLLKRTSANLGTRGSLGMVADVFAIILLGISLTIVAANATTKNLLVHEGDLYARSGSTGMARLVYLIAGVSPVFPNEKPGAKPAGSASGSTSGASSAAPPPPR
jgi:hypothetical protein